MVPGGPAYSQVVQHDAIASPTMSLSPTPSTSPMPLLPTAKTLTPLSMTSDDDSVPARSTKPAGGDGMPNVADQPANPNGGAGASTKIYEPRARATTAPNCLSAAPNSGPPEYEPVAPGKRQSPITTETLPSHSCTTITQPSPAASRHAAGFLANVDQVSAPSTTSASAQSSRLPPLDAGAAVAAAVAARARSSTTSSIRQRLQSLSPETSDPPVLVKPQPLLRTASTKSVSLRHPAPDITLPSARANNIAQLEATAERLSMTSSIDDAIRELHDEQKRADSRRSSIRAASVASLAESLEPPYSFSRQISGTSSILEINTAARQGGYSPAGYVMSPANSIRSTTSRLRSGSTGLHRTTTADMEETNSPPSRHGPGKGSVHSVRSAGKPNILTNIAEMEPTALTQEAMDAADRLPELALGNNTVLQLHDPDASDRTPLAQDLDNRQALDYWDQAVADSAQQGAHETHDHDNASLYAGSTGTFEQAELAFADFDGTHASPDVDHEDMPFMPSFEQVQQQNRVSFMMPLGDDMDDDSDMAASEFPLRRPQQQRASAVRPKSYMDPETGNTMLYYPARVPMMLNVPQKLSSKPKTDVRNKRRTQVLSDMTEQNRQSGMTWLPEFQNEPLMDPLLDYKDITDGNAKPIETSFTEGALPSPRLDLAGEPKPTLRENPPAGNEEFRQSRIPPLNEVDKRKSRMSVMLPPQLRASAFFDLPSETTNLELKDGSATATLDDILNASASAPVSAFTDHAFAGSLGSEVYGTDKKRKSQMNRFSTATALDPASRRSQMHLRKPSALSKHSKTAISQRSDSLKSDDDRSHDPSRRSGSAHGGRAHGEGSEGESDEERDEEDDEEEEEEEEEDLYNGPPTTLLAELQIRKQQQKLRTRVAAQAYPNGMHSTLLEMDAVKEVERNARKGRKIALAWEMAQPGDDDDSDDEDLPLGLLLATKSQGNLAAAVAELNRPMGLMEKREMEENEPLSQRRNRLLGPNAAPLRQTRSQMTLGHDRNAPGFLQPISPRLDLHTPEEEENEEETLGARKARLRAKADASLPEARPVSTAFSTELLDAFKGEETELSSKDKEAQPTEEEETLGQRRRRLQAEREAREQEMGATGGMLGITNNNTPASAHFAKKHSMADVLGVNYANRSLAHDPRTVAERIKQAEGARYKQEQDQKLAAYRNQLPGNLSTPNLHTPGGFKSGRFNDGTGGGLGQSRASMMLPAANGPDRQTGNPYLMNAAASSMNNFMQQPGFAPMQGFGVQPAYGAPGYGAPMMNPYGMPMHGQPGGPPMDRVEQWRQSVLQ